MSTYLVGPSVVRLTGHATASQPGSRVEHDFGLTGPDGEHGPAREAALLACGALKMVDPPEESSTNLPGTRRPHKEQ